MTKPSYEELIKCSCDQMNLAEPCEWCLGMAARRTLPLLESELARVRGLLQQAHKTLSLGGHKVTCGFRGCTCGAVEDFKTERLEFYRGFNSLKSSGAESADIGKLDTADKSACDEFRGDDAMACSTCGRPIQDHGSIVLPAEHMTREEFRKRYPGSAETGGEPAAEVINVTPEEPL